MELFRDEKEFLNLKEFFPHWGKGSRVRNKLPQSFEAVYKGPTAVYSQPDPGKTEIYRDGLEEGRRVGVTSINQMVRESGIPSGLL